MMRTVLAGAARFFVYTSAMKPNRTLWTIFPYFITARGCIPILGYISPNDYEQQLQQMNKVAN